MAQKEETPFPSSSQIDPVARYMLRDAASAHRTALYHYQGLGLTGRVIWVNGMIRGYSFGFERSSEVFCLMLASGFMVPLLILTTRSSKAMASSVWESTYSRSWSSAAEIDSPCEGDEVLARSKRAPSEIAMSKIHFILIMLPCVEKTRVRPHETSESLREY